VGTRWDRLIAEGGRFLAVGAVATVVALLVFNLLVHGVAGAYDPPLRGNAILGFVLGHTVGMVISYTGNRVWAFRDRETVHADGGVAAFFVINVVTMALPVACLAFSRDVLGLTSVLSDNVAANVIGQPLGLVARFLLFRRFVFRRPVQLLQMNLPPELVDELTPTATPAAPPPTDRSSADRSDPAGRAAGGG